MITPEQLEFAKWIVGAVFGSLLFIVFLVVLKKERDPLIFRSNGELSRCPCGEPVHPSQTLCIDCYIKHVRARGKTSEPV